MDIKCEICNEVFNNEDESKIHVNDKHYDKYEIREHECGCNNRFRYVDGNCLKNHLKTIHNMDVHLYICGFDCGFKSLRNDEIINHERYCDNRILSGVYDTTHSCNEIECDKNHDTCDDLRWHQISEHHYDIFNYICGFNGCTFKTCKIYERDIHLRENHSVYMKYECDFCEHITCNYAGSIKHERSIHNIGRSFCDVCWNKCYKMNYKFYDKDKYIFVCKDCYEYILKLNGVSGVKRKYEYETIDFLKFNNDKSILQIDKAVCGEYCQTVKRPDIMYACPYSNIALFVEIDEHQHKVNKYELQRMKDISKEIPNQTVVFIRYNPNGFIAHRNDIIKNINRIERLGILNYLINMIYNNFQYFKQHKFQIYYLFYSHSNKHIEESRNSDALVTTIYTINDCEKLIN